MIQPILDAILLAQSDPSQIPAMSQVAVTVEQLDDSQVDQLIEQLSDFADELHDAVPDLPPQSPLPRSRMDQILQPIIFQLANRESRRVPANSSKATRGTTEATEQASADLAKLSSTAPPREDWSVSRLQSIETLYRLTPAHSDLRNHLLRWLATARRPATLDLWQALVCHDPPQHRLGIVLAFAPLMQAGAAPSLGLLKSLLEHATAYSQIAPAVFDLCNYYFRTGQIATHPAAERAGHLANLLGELIQQMIQVEDGDFPKNLEAWQINQLVSDSVALIVSLCDTFALLQHASAIAKLHQALSLRHRRVQTEAAAALARLGDETGKQALIALAEQPISRLRVLAYADELNFKHEISLELQGEIAIAESHLAIWLSEPDQMGLAPSSIELIDHREMNWPSYDHPVQCYLFRYAYGVGESAHSNIGICGPLTQAFAADLQHLPIDEIYAAFAGWQTTHPEIFQMSSAKAQQAFPNEMRRLTAALNDGDLVDTKIHAVGSFFGERVLIASAKSENQAGTIIVDSHDSTWYEMGNPAAPIDWKLAYAIWRGKQLLAEFNPNETA